MTYTVLVYADEDDGGYWAKVAELPGCDRSGETIDGIGQNVRDAIDCITDRRSAYDVSGSSRVCGRAMPPPVAEKLEVVLA
ncbi:MAG TPA: type II toxin-antitoxin system HicB family antitoxin [Dehalococcoidia bacterium]|nr:type II toxin-antitoxin system HicB family antitoxin [Dehalococcoidia bacterium]